MHLPRLLRILPLLLCAVLAACASSGGPARAVYDFGPLPAQAAAPAPALAALVVADVTGPAWMDQHAMAYRLLYAEPMQARPYAGSGWSSTPTQLLSQRIRSRIAQAGTKVLNLTDAAAGLPLLRIEAEDFSQTFDSATSSQGRLTLRVSLFQGRKLVDQKTFHSSVPAASADAAGGVRALAAATDQTANDLIAWLATLPLPKQ